MYSNYYLTIKEELEKFIENPKALYIGQQTKSENFYQLLKDVPMDRRTEMPVMEEGQMSLSMGLAIEGFLPISIFQRMDFLPRAMDSLVNHLDLVNELSRGMYNPKVIIFTTIGTNEPFNVGLQHSKNLIPGLRAMLRNIPVHDLKTVSDVKVGFNVARTQDTSIILVARQELF